MILAAGRGTRLQPLTDDRPKCLVELAGRSLLARQLAVLRRAGVDDIVLIGGYRADMLQGYGCQVVRNPAYASTNMVATLFCAREHLRRGDEDLIVSYGDIVYEPRVLQALARCAAPVAVTVDRLWHRYWSQRMPDPLADAETLKIAPSGRLLELGKKPSAYAEVQAQYMGLYKVRADHLARFVAFYDGLDRTARYDGKDFPNMYMTSFLQQLIDVGWDVRAVPVDGGWLEADTVEDLELYHRLAREGRLGEFYDLAVSAEADDGG